MKSIVPAVGLLFAVVGASLGQNAVPLAVILDAIPGELDNKSDLTATRDTTTIVDNGTGQDQTKGDDEDLIKTAASQVAPSVIAKRDLQSSATGYGGIGGIGLGGGQIGGFGGGYGGGSGFGGGYGSNTGFGGQKKYNSGNQFGANYGGLNKNVKLVNDQYQTSQHGTKGVKGNQGFSGQQGHAKVENGHVNKGSKKGHFGTVGQASKAAKNDGTVYGNNNVATKFVKGTRFGNKGVHKKGHNTKGFHNTHHKDEFSKSHQFHDTKDDTNFFDKYGDEGAFNNNLAGKQFFNGHHANVFNKKNEGNEGNFVAGHHNVANKGNNAVFGNKGHQAHNVNFGQYGGQNYASGIGKGVHANNNYGGQFGGGGFGKLGGVGGSGHSGGFQGGAGNYGGGGGGYGFGGLGGGF